MAFAIKSSGKFDEYKVEECVQSDACELGFPAHDRCGHCHETEGEEDGREDES
jgi:hypothetical protein